MKSKKLQYISLMRLNMFFAFIMCLIINTGCENEHKNTDRTDMPSVQEGSDFYYPNDSEESEGGYDDKEDLSSSDVDNSVYENEENVEEEDPYADEESHRSSYHSSTVKDQYGRTIGRAESYNDGYGNISTKYFD